MKVFFIDVFYAKLFFGHISYKLKNFIEVSLKQYVVIKMHLLFVISFKLVMVFIEFLMIMGLKQVI